MRTTTSLAIERRRSVNARGSTTAGKTAGIRTPFPAWAWEAVDAGDREGSVGELFAGGTAGGDDDLLILQLEGHCEVRRLSDTLVIGTRDMLLLDVDSPVLLWRSAHSRQLCLALPRPPSPDCRHTRPPVVLRGETGIGIALQGLLLAVYPLAGTLSPSEQRGLRMAIGDLVLVTFEAQPVQRLETAVGPTPPPQFVALQATIEARLADPGLCPAQVAAIHGISTRQLHRRFKEAGTSFTAFVRQRRLTHCRDDLADPRWQRLPMTEIAFRWGFSDSSHFSHCFRAAFGCTARDFRAGQWPRMTHAEGRT